MEKKCLIILVNGGTDEGNKNQSGFELDILKGKKFEEAYLGGKKVKEYLEDGVRASDLECYKPADPEVVVKKKY